MEKVKAFFKKAWKWIVAIGSIIIIGAVIVLIVVYQIYLKNIKKQINKNDDVLKGSEKLKEVHLEKITNIINNLNDLRNGKLP
jgi:hypothetical protein